MPANLYSICVTVELVFYVKTAVPYTSHPRKTRNTKTISPILLYYSLWQVHSRQCKYKQNMLVYLASPAFLYNLSGKFKSYFFVHFIFNVTPNVVLV
jgi:hypothetical protein